MMTNSGSNSSKQIRPEWYPAILTFAHPDLRKAIWQIINTFIPYFLLWGIMIYLVRNGFSYWFTLAIAILAAAFLVRIFIIFHDCCHGSFFVSRRANTIIGYLTGILTFTPFEQWRSSHAKHHMTAGDLDRRGTGDVWTMTVAEFQASSPKTQLQYRLYRHPLVMFILGPIYIFLLSNRFSYKHDRTHERRSVAITNLGLLAWIISMSLLISLKTFLLIQLPVIYLASILGVWLFYVQHQFETVYWARHEEWNRFKAAMEGSSFYQLPKILQWFSGNIGLHHIHHVRSSIPNYNLQKCYDSVPELRTVAPLTLKKSLKSIRMNLWDEQQREW